MAARRFDSTWARRSISMPAHAALLALYLALAPAAVLGTLAWDLLGRGARALPRTRALAFFGLYLGCELAGLAAALAIWLVTAGGRLGGPARYLAAHYALQRAWTDALFRGTRALFSMTVSVEGSEAAARGPLLLFARHTSTADSVLAAALFANPRRLRLRYVLKRELLWDPCLDVVGLRLPNAFVRRSGPRPEDEVAAVARLADGLDDRSGVLIYPEGTRFSEAKLVAAVEALRAKGEASLAELAAGYRHVLPPRLGGALALLSAAPGVDVVFLEQTGFEGAATFRRFWSGALVGRTVHVRLRRFAAAEIPAGGRARWLFERWAETDAWIAEKRSAERRVP